MLPDVGAEQRVWPSEIGESWFAVLVTASPEPSCTSHAQPEPNRFTPASFELLLEGVEAPNFSSIAEARSPVGSPLRPGS